MIEIEGPDGSVIEFPPGTDDATIAKAMKKAFPSKAMPDVSGLADTMEKTAPNPAPEAPITAEGIFKAAGSGLASGAAGLAGLPDFIGDAWNWAGDKATDVLFPDDPKVKEALEKGRSYGAMRGLPSAADAQKEIEKVTGELYQPQNTTEEFVRTAGEFAPGIAAGPGGIARRALTQVAAPAIGSEAAGQAFEGTEAEPYMRMAGAIGGAFAPGLATRAITPFPIAPERAAMVKTLADEGVPLTAGQKTGNRGLQYAESLLADVPFGSPRAKQFADTQGDAFSQAMMRRVGEDAPAVPETVKRARDRIKQGYDDITSRNTVAADQQFANDIIGTVREYARVLPANQKEVFGNMAGDIVDRFAGGASMPGKDYQAIRSRLTSMARDTTDSQYKEALKGLRNSLDDAFSRQVTDPADAANLKTLNRQYSNLKTVEKTVTGAGENAAFGRPTPAKLRSSIATGQNRGAYARGEGDFAELARAGEAVMTPLPNSGTAQRNFIASMVGGGAGAAAVADAGLTAATAIATPAVLSRLVHSKFGQGYLANQLLAAMEKMPPARRAAMVTWLSSQDARGPGQQIEQSAQ